MLGEQSCSGSPLTMVIIGASGDLAKKKVIPALFALYCQRLLPERFNVVGLARTQMTSEEFRQRVMANLTCRYTPQESCAERMDEFLARCHYVAGRYDSSDSFLDLYGAMRGFEDRDKVNRIYYMAIPPFLFMPVAKAIGDAGLVECGSAEPWSRVVIEKPFGRDRESSDDLVESMRLVFTEEQTFRIDHYLGKEVIQNLLVLRFANHIFSPLWSGESIQSVEICWKEDIGVGDRGGYFDGYGIVRDVMQNHLLQILALVAMEQPESLSSRHVRDEKVRVLRSIPALTSDQIVLGQYAGAECNGFAYPAYVEEESVPADSVTPTYAAAVLSIDTPRWHGVPFIIKAGKGLDSRMTEIRVRFRPVEHNLFSEKSDPLPPNELIVRVQPDESISFRIVNKAPGLDMQLADSYLDLRYKSAFTATIPDAYECLLLDVIRGEKSLFIRSDELAAAWDVFTPVLREHEQTGTVPVRYAFGSAGPDEALGLSSRFVVVTT